MTEAELVADLSRLLREGLVVVDTDEARNWDYDTEEPPRFYVTRRGRELLATEPVDATASVDNELDVEATSVDLKPGGSE